MIVPCCNPSVPLDGPKKVQRTSLVVAAKIKARFFLRKSQMCYSRTKFSHCALSISVIYTFHFQGYIYVPLRKRDAIHFS
jgi:hypothetical protein